MYKGIKCGSESGLLYLVNPFILSEDTRGKVEGLLESPVGDEVEGVRISLFPIADIGTIKLAR